MNNENIKIQSEIVKKPMILLGIDTGGTFTDFVFKCQDGWNVYKIPSTPSDPSRAVIEGINHIVKDETSHVVHGSTVATNAILEGKGAITALVTNRGFVDVLDIGRQNRNSLYQLAYHKSPSLVPEHLRFGLEGRIGPLGEIIQELNDRDIRELANRLKGSRIESIAVCLLFSFKNPGHEIRVREMLASIQVPISLSHEILSEFREFERTSTTVLNAYVSPKMKNYIDTLAHHIGSEHLRIMQSNGGSIQSETAMNESVRTILSGPAGGAVGAFEISKTVGIHRIITFDMGGTSTDVALIDDKLPLTTESDIGTYPVNVPMLDIHTVGAGGGSIAHIDTGGSLQVGPESAGADPGPICYGHGDRITVTDANLFLNRILPDHFLGGKMVLDPKRLVPYMNRKAGDIGLTPVELAEGILSVANAVMERAIRVISVERGYDPRLFTLFSFGGAGGMHAVFLAKLLQIPQVLIPRHPGILSAIGMLMADVIRDYSLTVMIDPKDTSDEEMVRLFRPLENRGTEELSNEGIHEDKIFLERMLDMRYRGQSYELMVPFENQFMEAFHRIHEQRYGYCNKDKEIEIVNIRLRARGIPEKPVVTPQRTSEGNRLKDAVIRKERVVFDGKVHDTLIIRRENLNSGTLIDGPAILVEYSATIVIPPDANGRIDDYGNVIIWIDN